MSHVADVNQSSISKFHFHNVFHCIPRISFSTKNWRNDEKRLL